MKGRVRCIRPLTLEYSSHTIYWADHCRQSVESIRMDGSYETHSVVATGVHFSYGIAIYNSSLYWTQIDGVYALDVNDSTSATSVKLVETSSLGAQGIQVVHSSKQPNGELCRESLGHSTI